MNKKAAGIDATKAPNRGHKKATGIDATKIPNKGRRTHNISIRVTEDLYHLAAQAAQRDARSMANWIEILIVQAVGANPPPRRGVRILDKDERGARIRNGLRTIHAEATLEPAGGE